MSTQLKQRLLISTLGILILSLAIYFSYTPFFKPIFILFNAAIVNLALLEYYQLAENKGFYPLKLLGITFTCLYIFGIYLNIQYPNLNYLPPLILFISLITFFMAFFKSQENPLINLAITTFGLIYLTIPLSFALKLNYFSFEPDQSGRIWLAYTLIVTKMTDTGAYFFGKTVGKTKLAPHISPKKTIEGAIGGLMTSLLTSLIFTFLIHYLYPLSPIKMTLWQSAWISLLISLTAQFGDLVESILKRDAGVKDSSHLPGLGGMLDIVDSLIFTLPLMYFILKMGWIHS
jgi:phosphatidate cytidylyltransferase